MGRKIPGKKHRGVKDPNKQRAKREAELETKINAPPKNIDDQATPKSLERLIKLKNNVKNNGLVQKKKKKKGLKLISVGAEQQYSKLPHPKAKPDKVVPIFNQKPGESGEHFLHRVNRETRAFVKEIEFETKFNVEVKRDPKTGLINDVIKKPKDEIDELAKLQSKHKNIKKKKKTLIKEGEVKLTKSQKRREKLLKKKQKKISENDEIKEFKKLDKVEFGEVAHAPPELKVSSKNNINNKFKATSLLLSSLLQENHSPKSENTKTINKSGKRKDLPLGERRQLEKQQNEAIAAYRLLKTKKFGETSLTA